jgi:hypothetical protein
MSAVRLSLLAIAFFLSFSTPAAAQRPERMSADLAKALRDVTVQKQLIAAGVLDAVAGRASRFELRRAIDWFRKAYRFKGGSVEPLTAEERTRLSAIYAEFEKITGFKEHAHDDPETKKSVKLRLPLQLVKGPHANTSGDSKWWEYRADDNSVSVGPVVHPLSEVTPIALFKERIMGAALKYKHLHLTSDEFTALGETGDDRDGYASYNLVLSYSTALKGFFMRYAKRAPDSFALPGFLAPVVETEPLPAGLGSTSETIRPNPRTRGWQLLMGSVGNLIAGDFPFDNDWERVSTKDCPLTDDAENGDQPIRILFGTDRKILPAAPRAGRADPDALFGPQGSGGLHLGCVYVSRAAARSGDMRAMITDYKLIRESKRPGDIGDRIYLTDETGETGMSRADALVFIHGYNVSFKDALATVSKVVAETGYEGRVYMYSWPSAYSTFSYIQDLDNAEQAEPFFQSFMRMLMRDANIYDIDVLAHSMGSQTLVRAVSALRPIFETQRGAGRWARPIRIGQMVFAAPDVAMSVFDQKMHRIAPYAKRVTVYASSTDTALLASKLLRGGVPRVGDLLDGEPIVVDIDNVHIIDASGKERWYRLDRVFTGYGHDYFSQEPAVLADIREILTARRGEDERRPDERSSSRFEKVPYKSAPGRFYWRLKEK